LQPSYFTLEISPVSLPELRTRVDEVLSTGCRTEAEAAFGQRIEDGYRLPSGARAAERRSSECGVNPFHPGSWKRESPRRLPKAEGSRRAKSA